MRDSKYFDRTECERMEGEIRSMCGKIKLVAPPSMYSFEDALAKIVGEETGLAGHQPDSGRAATFLELLTGLFNARRLSNLASSVIVLIMLMIIPLALFSNRGMAMNTAETHSRQLSSDDELREKCVKRFCGDERYGK